MRICLFTPTFLPDVGGAERMADLLVRGLIRRGHEVQVLAQHTGQPDPQLPYPVRRFRRPPALHLLPESLSHHVTRMWRKWHFDLMIAMYGYPTGYAAARVKKRLGFKLITNGQGADLYPNYHALKKVRVRNIIAKGYGQADHVIVVSQWLADRVRLLAPQPHPPIHVIPNGIDMAQHTQRLAIATEQGQKFAREVGLLQTPFALHLGRVCPVKCVDLAVEAVTQLAPHFRKQGWRYVIVGHGSDLLALQKRIQQNGVGDIVFTLGTRRGVEKDWLLGHAQCLVSTSREEGLPVTLTEALGSGLPILASNIGPHREVLAGTEAGVLFEHPNIDDLAHKLKAMMTEDLKPRRHAALALRGQYDLEHILDRYEAVCLGALAD